MSDTPGIDNLMHDLRTKGRTRLIQGYLGRPETYLQTEVYVDILREHDLWTDEYHEIPVVTLDTLEMILRWARDEGRKDPR